MPGILNRDGRDVIVGRGRETERAASGHGLDRVHQDVDKRVANLFGDRGDLAAASISLLDLQLAEIVRRLQSRQRLVELKVNVHGSQTHPCVACRHAGKVSDDGRHAPAVLDDVTSEGSDMVEVDFFLNGFA